MRVCIIYNFAQHYRRNIFSLMDQTMNVDFYFGDHYLNVEKMDYSVLHHKVTEIKNINIGLIKWQKGVIKLAFMNYDTFIVLGNPMVLSTWFLLILGRLLRKNVFLWTHGWYGKETRFEAIIKKMFFGLASGCFLYGNYARKLMINEGLKSSKLKVIHNSLLYDMQVNLRKELRKSSQYINHFGNNYHNVVFIGRLIKSKKLDQLLRAQFICINRGFNINITFIGDGQVLEDLKCLAKSLGSSNQVWFYGPSYDENELSQLLYDADLCVSPGNIGLTAMHAMVYGCPCVSHNDFKWQGPEFEAIKEGITGSFFERDNIESLADCIQNWLTNADREVIRAACFIEIDEEWNPHKQLEIIKKTIRYD